MDAIAFLKQEHQKAKAAFAQVLHGSTQDRGRLWKELKPELVLHEQIEETYVYEPLSRDAVSKDAKLGEWEQHHHQEVQKVEGLLKEIDKLDPQESSWMSKVKEVHSSLEHHIMEEEQDIFPRIGKVWDPSRLEDSGAKMEEAKSKTMQHT